MSLQTDWYQRFSSEPKRLVGLQDVRDKALAKPDWFIHSYLVIVDIITKNDMLFEWNNTQVMLWNMIWAIMYADLPVRLVILKSRQVGITTMIVALLFTLWWARRNFNAIITAHLKEVTTIIFRKVRKFYASLPPEFRMPLERSNKQELLQDVVYGGSHLNLMTAGTPHGTRSQTLDWYEGTEAAFFPDGNLFELKDALEASIQLRPGTGIIFDSTANGSGTEFHQLFLAALEGETIYKAKFLEWFKDDLCSMAKFESDYVRDSYLERIYAKCPELKDRKEHYDLTAEQICWYFIQCMDRYRGEWLRMQQEFPCDHTEAFLASGKTVIPTWVIEAYRNKTRDGVMYDPTALDWGAEISSWRRDDSLVHERNKKPYIEVFAEPVEGEAYLIFLDTASGHGADNSCGQVLHIATQNQVAEIHGKIEPKQFALWAMRVGRTYNNAVICCELNGLGLATQSHMEDRYFNLYRRRHRGSIEGPRITDKLGWDMTEDLRWQILAETRRKMTERLNDDDAPHEFMPGKGLNQEFHTFVQPALLNKKPEAEKGCNDDRVIAMCAGIQACLDEIYMRPDLRPLAYKERQRDNDKDGIDLEELNTLTDDARYTGLEEFTPEIPDAGPFIVKDLDLDDEDDEETPWL